MGSKQACELEITLLKNMHKEISLSLSPSLHSPSLQKDWKKIFRRSSCEGVSFMTTTLPLLGKMVIQSFKTGMFICPTAFKKQKGTMLPRLYNGLFCRIYKTNGVMLEKPCIESVRLLNQLSFLFYKYEVGYTEKQLSDATEKYISIENELKSLFLSENDGLLIKAKSVITGLFKDFNPLDIKPHASDGALATGEIGANKFKANRLYREIHRVYPYYTYFVPSPSSIPEQVKNVGLVPNGYLEWYKGLKIMASGTSKLCFVEKDSRGPRSISMEPAEYQYIQQGLKDALYAHLEKVTNYQINFESQEYNRNAAIAGSIDGSYNTYDFSSASDRVSVELVNYLFRDVPKLLNALHACRSTHTELPDGSIIRLRKFAPMGSAICFPVMASIIYAIAKAMCTDNRVIVYGDDLILEDDSSYTDISSVFEKYGLKLNDDKSFDKGFFRESCGADAFQGQIITPIKIKKDLKCRTPEQFAAIADSSNEFYTAGYWHLAGFLRKILQLHVNHTIPTSSVLRNAPGINFYCVTDAIEDVVVAIDKRHCLPIYKRRCLELVVPKRATNVADEFGYMIAMEVGGGASDSPPSTVIVRDTKSKSKLRWKWRNLSYTDNSQSDMIRN